MSRDRFFIGWEAQPDLDRRTLLLGAGALTLAGAGLGAAIARAQQTPQAGAWRQGEVRAWRGTLARAPYPMLRMRRSDGAVRTAFLATSGKTSVASRIPRGLEGGVVVRASPIEKGEHLMLAAVDGADWIAPDDAAPLAPPAETDLGAALHVGEILDAKCWFGAMRPGYGKTHKACASLCARGGLPLAFCIAASGVCGGEDAESPLFLDENGAAHGRAIIPLVADPVLAIGRMVRVGDVTQFRAALRDIRRL